MRSANDSHFLSCLVAAPLALLLGFLPVAVAAPSSVRDFSQWLEPYRTLNELPALGAVVVSSEGLQALGVSGQRSVHGEALVCAEDRWHLGSVSKSMTATVAARLIAAGRISFETTVREAVGEQFPGMHRGYRRATLRDLLAHQGGLTGDLTRMSVWRSLDIVEESPQRQRQLMLEELLKQRPAFRPGSDFLYSNAGYVLAAVMLESVTGRSWESLIQDELFEPLGLVSAGIGAPGDNRRQPDQPWGHRLREELQAVPPGPYADHPAALAPAGRVHMNLFDLGSYLQLHLSGAQGRGDYLPPEVFQQLHRPVRGQPYALGWSMGTGPHASSEWPDSISLSHEGSNTLWFAVVWIAPERDLALAVVTNRVPAELDSLGDIATQLWRSIAEQ